MPDPEIVVRGRSDLSAIDRGINRTSGGLAKFARRSAAVAATALVGVTAAAIKFGEAAAEDEKSAALLAGTLERAAGATDKQKDAVERYITAQGKLLGVTDDELRPALGTLVTATEDVAEAQKLASLAQDVAVGRGKSLESVALALAKAENGQVSALSRLGIQTKDASGETLSFERVTRKLSDTFGGAAAEKADTLSGRVDRLKLMLSEAGEEIGYRVIPPLTDLATYLAENSDEAEAFVRANIVPYLKDAGHWLAENRDEFADMAETVRDVALPVLKTTVDIGGKVVDVLAALPDPVQKFAVQAGLAALVVPRLTGAISAGQASMGGYISRMRDAETRTAALGKVARNAAGIGGLALLASSAGKTESAIGKVSSIAGAGLTGFAVGGPWGAALAAGATALTVFSDAGNDAIDMEEALALSIQDVIQTLDEQTGAFTKATRATVSKKLEDAGLLKMAQDIGIPLQTVTKATLQGREAIFAWRTEMLGMTNDAQERTNIVALASEMQGLNEELFEGQSAWARNREAMGKGGAERQAARAEFRSLTESMNLVPKDLRTVVKTINADQSEKTIQRMQRIYHLTPTELKTIVAALGTEQASRKLLKVRDDAKAVEDVQPKMEPWLRALTRGLSAGEREAASTASSIGTSLSSGIMGGISGLGSRLSASLSGIVSQGIAAAKRAADAHSPSKKMEALGHDLGDGLIDGTEDRRDRAERAGKDLVESVLKGARSGSEGVAKALELVTKEIERRVKLKDDEKEQRREREILKSLRGRIDALKEAGKAQDRLNEKIDEERANLRGLIEERKQYAATLTEGLRSYTSLSNLISTEEGAINDAPSLLERLRQRLGDTRQFEDVLDSLTRDGLGAALVDQLADAGVEGGLAIAQAIAAGGPAAIAEFNVLQGQIDAVTARIGSDTADYLYNSGIASARGLVAGLESESARLEQWAEKLARKMVRALKRELGITEPEERGQLVAETYAARPRPTLNTTPAGGSTGATKVTINVNAPVGSSKAEIGAEVKRTLDAYYKAGGRDLAIG